VAFTTQSITRASIPLCKTAPAKGVTFCYGRASDGRVDRDGQIVDEAWSLAALRDWLDDGGTVRLAHNPQRPVGKGVQVDGHFVKSAIYDKESRRLLKHQVLRAYSIGIGQPVIKADPMAPGGRIVGGQLLELSIVDSPSNVGCGVTLVKARADGSPQFIGKAFGTPALTKKKHKAPLIMCTKCGTELDAGERYCTGCGRKNPHHNPLADKKIPLNEKGAAVKAKKIRKRRLAKAAGGGLLTKAGREREFEAMRPSVYDPDPAVAQLAWDLELGRAKWRLPE
jgi:hypothetical protein